jgi:amino acid transporter
MQASAVPGGRGVVRQVFFRNATGLVRELTPFDAFNLVFSAVLIPVGITQVMSFAPQFWPGANMVVSFLIATPLVFCTGLVYLYFTVAMPRSGGDYVWVSRALHPLLGFLVNVSLTFVFLTWVAFNFTTMMGTFIPSLGYVAGYTWSLTQGQQLLIATVLTLAFGALMVAGVKRVARYMAALFVIVWIGMALWLGALLFGDHATFTHTFDATAGDRLAHLQALAAAGGYHPPAALDWAATLAAMVYCFQVFTGFQWTGYFSGEVKNVRRTALWSIMGALVVSALLYAIGSALIYRFYGFRPFGALVYLAFNDTKAYHLAFQPYLASMVAFIGLPGVLRTFIAACFLLAVLWWTPTGYLIATRNMFAWSMDRLLPTRVADVSARFHTPVVATAIVTVAILGLNVWNIYGGLGAYLLNIIAVMACAFIVVSIAAVAFPFTRRDLYASAPAMVRVSLGPVPVICIAGAISALAWLFVLYETFTTTAFGQVSLSSMLQAFTVPIVALIWYLANGYVRRQQGLELAATFSAIPPE